MSLYTPEETKRLTAIREKTKAGNVTEEEMQEMVRLIRRGASDLKERLMELDKQLEQREKERPWIYKSAKFLARLKGFLSR